MSSTQWLLICTVGGSKGPIRASIIRCKPRRVLFIASPQSRSIIDEVILDLHEEDIMLTSGQYAIEIVDDSEKLEDCVASARGLESEVMDWVNRSPEHRVMVDITPGTKCMSASLALAARRWPCTFSYVGGTDRTKGGRGTVVDGAEHVISTPNPWDLLGYQATEEALTLCGRHHYAAAAAMLSDVMKQMASDSAKQELNALQHLIEALAAWDRFDHDAALEELRKVKRYRNDLQAVLGSNVTRRVLRWVEGQPAYLEKLKTGQPDLAWVSATSWPTPSAAGMRAASTMPPPRVYRATEAFAQVRLTEAYGLDAAKVPLAALPEPLRKEWAKYADAEGTLRPLPLQAIYELLDALGDSAGRDFRQRGWDKWGQFPPEGQEQVHPRPRVRSRQ